MLVSVIIPAYKQEHNIQQNVENIYEAMKKTRWDFELIVVVDGFLDKTFEEASKLHHPKLTVVGYPTNYGKGYAVRYGMARASGEYIAFIDGGMEIDANGISMILEHMEWYNADIIVASKRHLASRVQFPFLRRFYSFGYHLLVRILFGLKIRDTQTGLKVYKRKVLEDVLPRLIIKEYAFDIELLAVAHYLGYKRIYEAPVEIKLQTTDSKFKGFLLMDPYIRKMLNDTLGVFYRLHFLKYYHDNNKRKWIYNEELHLKVNTGEK